MRKNFYTIVAGTLLSAFFLPCITVSAQDITADLKKIKATYAGFTSVSYEAEYKSYLNKLSDNPVDITHGSLVQQGDNKYQKVAGIEIMNNKEYTFTVDHATHHMYYSPSYMNMKEEVMQMDVNKIMELCSIEKKEMLDATHQAYVLVPKRTSDDFEKVRLVYDTKNFMVTELQLNYARSMEYVVKGTPMKGKPILVISYKNYKVNQSISEHLFTYNKFVRKAKDKLMVKDTYKNYTINGARELALKNN